MSALSPKPGAHPTRMPNARELLHAMLDHAHLDGFQHDGRARLSLTLSPAMLEALVAWGADDREDDEIDEGAGEQTFYGSGCKG